MKIITFFKKMNLLTKEQQELYESERSYVRFVKKKKKIEKKYLKDKKYCKDRDITIIHQNMRFCA